MTMQNTATELWFSPSKMQFFADVLEQKYKAAGVWPSDLVPVSRTVWETYMGIPPNGMKLGVGSGNQPTWVQAGATT